MAAFDFELTIIGAGSGGLTAAGFAAKLGARVALVEKRRIGGDCTWTGCVPSKALLKAAKIAHEVRGAARFGIVAQAPIADMKEVREYVRGAIRQVYRLETPEELRKQGIEVIEGAARFIDAHTIMAGGRTIRSKRFLIATGARPLVPEIAGLEAVPFMTYEQIFENDRLPDSLIVAGGGPIGMEMAQAYRRLGAQVTVVAKHILPKDEPEARETLRRVFEREGVRFVAGCAESVRMDAGSFFVSTGLEEIRGDMFFLAAGRRPSVAGLDLEKAGVKYSAEGIPVDGRLRTNVNNIYGAGDVLGGQQFTHLAGWQAFQAARNALLPGSSSGFTKIVPWATFTDPEVAHVGLTEEQARARFGEKVKVCRWDADHTDRAMCEDDRDGFVKIIAADDQTLLGATVVSSRAGETIAEFVPALARKMKISDLAGAMRPYPTYSTAVQQLAAQMSVEASLSGTSGEILRWLARLVR